MDAAARAGDTFGDRTPLTTAFADGFRFLARHLTRRPFAYTVIG